MNLPYCLSLLSSMIFCASFAYADEAATIHNDNVLPTITVKADQENQTTVATKTRIGKVDTPINQLAQSVHVITRQTMNDQMVQNINEAVGYSAGVLPAAYGFDSRYDWPFIRGYSALGDIWRDGLRQVNLNFIVPRINQYGIEQVEVLKGPASVLYGQGNPGGMINLSTKRPTTTPLHEVGVTLGSHDKRQFFGDVSEALNEQWKLRFTSMLQDADSMLEHSQDDSFYVAPSLLWQPNDKTELTIFSQFQRDQQVNGIGGTPAPYMTDYFYQMTNQYLASLGLPNMGVKLGKIPREQNLGNPDYDRFDRDYGAFGYQLKHVIDPVWTLNQNVRAEYSDLQYNRAQLTGAWLNNLLQPIFIQQSVAVNEHAATLSMDQNLTGQWQLGRVNYRLITGLDLYYLDGKQREANSGFNISQLPYDSSYYPVAAEASFPVDQSQTKNSNAAIYALNQFKFDQHWIVNLAGRYDWNKLEKEGKKWILNPLTATNLSNPYQLDRTEKVFTGQASLMYSFDNGLAPYISYSTGFTPSKETDKNGNLLKSEKSKQVEAGLKWLSADQNLLLSTALYQLTKQNETRRNPFTQENQQTGEVQSRGAELEADLKLPYGFNMVGSFTYNDAKIKKDEITPEREGTALLLNPKQSANLWINYKPQFKVLAGLTAGAGVRYVGKMDYLDDNAVNPAPDNLYVPIHLDARTFVDATLGYEWDKWLLSFKVNNLENKQTFSWCMSQLCQYDEGRSYLGSVKYRW